jgi:uncharacterized protein
MRENAQTIGRFLACRRVALVGVSRNPADFSRGLLREMVARGYDVVPVNPAATEVDGRPCFPTMSAISPPVEAALLMTAPGQTAQAAQDCLDAGVNTIWFHRGMGRGAATPAALRACAERGAHVVAGECLYMHLPHASLPHRVHGFLRHIGEGRRAGGSAREADHPSAR